MTSAKIRDQVGDTLLTPKNSAILIIDYQPVQVTSVSSMDRQLLVNNVVGLAKIGQVYDVPTVVSTANVKSGLNKPTISQLREVLGDEPSYDRTSINAWEDTEFVNAVKATNRKKLIIAALWTEVCLAFPALDALKEGYEVYVPVDCVGGTSVITHETGLRRIEQAGGVLITWSQLACELQRDWARKETVSQFVDIFIQTGGNAGLQFAYSKD